MLWHLNSNPFLSFLISQTLVNATISVYSSYSFPDPPTSLCSQAFKVSAVRGGLLCLPFPLSVCSSFSHNNQGTTMCCFQILTNCLTVWLYLKSLIWEKTRLWWQSLKSLLNLNQPINNPKSPQMSYIPVNFNTI